MKIKNLKEKLAFLSAYILLVVILNLFGAECIFKRIFSVSCVGCGMTRAATSLLSLDFKAALYYHPMVFSLPVLLLYFLFDGNLFKNKTVNRTVLVLIFVGFSVNWAINLLTGKPI